jgi:hypothetical protein
MKVSTLQETYSELFLFVIEFTHLFIFSIAIAPPHGDKACKYQIDHLMH